MNKFLDLTGLAYLWTKIKTWVKGYVSISVNNDIKTITFKPNFPNENGSVSAVIPSKTSQLTNDSKFAVKSDDLASGKLVYIDGNTGELKSSSIDSVTGGADTKNTTGATDSSAKLFVVGAQAQSAEPLTYTHDTVWIGTDGKLHSGVSGTNPTTLLITDSTVATASDLATKATDTGVVHKTGNETISGEKTFNDGILLHSTVASEQEPVEGEEQATTTEDTVLSGSYIYHQGHDDFSWIITSANEETNVGDGTSLQNALDAKLNSSTKGQANGVASLDSSGKVPSSQLPSYVDDVIEVYARTSGAALGSDWFSTTGATGIALTPEAGKIYVLMADSGNYSANSLFRWSGTSYVKLNDGGVSAMSTSEMDTATNNWS